MPTAAISEPMKPTQEAPAGAAPEAASVLAFPASASQQMFWYLDQIQPGVTAFNVPLRFRLEGPLRPDLLKRTLNTIVERHESLRTHFAEDNGELLQIVRPELALDLPVIDISHLPADRVQEEADRLASIEARRPFQPATGPLVRAELVRFAADRHILHVTAHHAVFDGMSMTVLTREIAAIYQAYFDGRPCPLDPLPLQYGDFSVWQKDFLEGPEMKQQLGYWKRKLEGMTEVDLPTDFPRPAVKAWRGEIISTLFPKELTDRLHAIAARHGATLFHLQLAAYMLLLSRYSGAADIAIGTPVTGRTRGELEGVIGVFINSLIMRGDLSGNPSFGKLVESIRDTALEALENQELPFEALVRELKPDRDPGRNPLFQVNFNHHRSFAKPGDFGGVSLSPVPSRSPGTIFDLHFFMVERAEGWRASLDYSTDLFTRESAERMLGHFKRLHEDIAGRPDATLDELEILTDPEQESLDRFATGDTADYPRDASIGSLFLETAAQYPDRVALAGGSRQITYRQLRTEVLCLARTLLDKGVKPGAPVAYAGPQDIGMVTAFLATLLSGGFCVPLDPSYPAERFALLLDECGAGHILVSGRAERIIPAAWSGTIIEVPEAGAAEHAEALPPIAVNAEQAAFLMFTSGSTGRPKGVLVPHRGIVRLVKGCDFISITADDVFLQAAPASFDATHLELWGPLLNGGKLVLLPEGPGLEAIAHAVRHHGVTTLWLTSGLFQLMIDEHADALKGLRFLLSGGDVLSPAHVRKALDALPDTTLINGYGPTENTTFTTCHRITRDDLAKPSIPIGRPVAHTTVRILDAKFRPVPVGIPGELWTGGDGLAIGYLNAPGLTEERFVNHPRFGRMYRTGDRCRWRADGTIEFFGRGDHQVKVRGFRIELGEIEGVLAAHPSVKAARVAVRGKDSETKRILAWVVPADGAQADADVLMRHVESSLPVFMRPEAVTVLPSFPLNANGKVDLAALPDPAAAAKPTTTSAEPPQGPAECRVAAIWEELLGKAGIGRHDDFFALGGHSLLALRMFSRINREFGKSLPLATLIQHPTIAALSGMISPPPAGPSGADDQAPRGNLVTLSKGGGGTPLFCIHGGDGGVLFYRGLADRLPKSLPFHAIESLELGNNGPISPASIGEVAKSYLREILKIQPTGPVRLAGYSYGGVVAHEIACQLAESGRAVEFLGLFDTHNPAAPTRRYGMLERLRVFWNERRDVPFGRRLGMLRARIADGIHTHRTVRREIARATASGPGEAFSDLRRVQVREENWRAMQDFRPRRFAGRITLFKTNHPNDKIEYLADYGWTEAARDGLEIVAVTGHHLDLFSPENIGTLAEALSLALTRATTRST